MTARNGMLLAAVLIAGAGCRHLAASEGVAAVLVSPTPAVRTQLRDTLRMALGNVPLTIADDAFVRSNVLLIERARPRGSEALTGRTVEAVVDRFELVVERRRCTLVRRADGWRATLPSATCIPL